MNPAEAPPHSTGAAALFHHELRRDGRTVVVLHGLRQQDGSAVVETTVTPTGRDATAAIARPFTFTDAEHARRFADETVVALEYLGCEVAGR